MSGGLFFFGILQIKAQNCAAFFANQSKIPHRWVVRKLFSTFGTAFEHSDDTHVNLLPDNTQASFAGQT